VAVVCGLACEASRFVSTADFQSGHLIALFARMARTYGAVNLLSSFGFSHLWRKACVRELEACRAHRCADLMAGMGEASLLLAREAGEGISVDAVDFCPAMCERARRNAASAGESGIRVTEADVLGLEQSEAYDRVVASFGLKTLDDRALRRFATVLFKLMKPGARAVLVEIHGPSNALRSLFLFYMRYVIPCIGRLMLGDPDCYRSLSVYTESFAVRDRLTEDLRAAGFVASERSLFFGCARLYRADKPVRGVANKTAAGSKQ
jgi:demethylmenaquinone methyltransferase/2-methoxy-6-polyprenyl-1,4-benzoquinol methylase